jgi:hypothetical protein
MISNFIQHVDVFSNFDAKSRTHVKNVGVQVLIDNPQKSQGELL